MGEATSDEQLGVRPGDVLADRYCVGRVLARGGMGYVVEATHRELGTAVAIKVLKVKFARDETYLARFRREALAAARLRSEHIVRVIDFGRVPGSGAPFLVMEYLEGNDLSSSLAAAQARGEPLPAREVCDCLLQACTGLAVAHAAGIVHRDLKPANLFLARQADGSACVKVLDFGISKHGTSEAMVLTAPREVLGSPVYMSPEQLMSPRAVDARSDLWSLGVILFELLAGRLPFDDEEFGELFMRIQTKEPPSLLELRPDLPAGLAELVARCLQKNPTARHANVAALARELAPFASPDAEHYVNATRRASGRHAAFAALDLGGARAHATPAAPWPSAPTGDESWARSLRPRGPFALARRLFGAKTLAPLAGDAEGLPSVRGARRRSRRIVLFAALAGVALGCGGWAFARRLDPPRASARGVASVAPALPPDVGAAALPPDVGPASLPPDVGAAALPPDVGPAGRPEAPRAEGVASVASPPPSAPAKRVGAKRKQAAPSIY